MRNESPSRRVQRHARRLVLESAVFNWRSGLLLALTALFVVAGPTWTGLPWGLFFAADGLAWLAVALLAWRDPVRRSRAATRARRLVFNPTVLHDDTLCDRIEKALSYCARLDEPLVRAHGALLSAHLRDLTRDMDEWLDMLYRLARCLDAFESDEVIQQDLLGVPAAMRTLQARLAVERETPARDALQRTLDAREAQQTNLVALSQAMQAARLQIENALTAMGTLYSQQVLAGARELDGSRASRLQEDLREQVAHLGDLLVALDEVYGRSGHNVMGGKNGAF